MAAMLQYAVERVDRKLHNGTSVVAALKVRSSLDSFDL